MAKKSAKNAKTTPAKKSDKTKQSVQMYLSEEEEWTRLVPVLDSLTVSNARQGQVDEYIMGLEKEEPLAIITNRYKLKETAKYESTLGGVRGRLLN